MAHCLIALGSNLGDRGALLTAARDQLAALPDTSLLQISSFRDSKPAGGPAAQPPYLNAAATLETALSPQQLLHQMQRIENELGRERSERWGPRTIDLDLLLYDQLELESPELTLPHPRMSFRRFVLEPAAEIAGEMVYPINGWTIEKLVDFSGGDSHCIALTPLHSRYFSKSPATTLLKRLELREDVQPHWRIPAQIHTLTRAEMLRNRRFQAESNRKLSKPVKSTAKWIIMNHWMGQSYAERFHDSPNWQQLTAQAMEPLEFYKLVVVWHPDPTEDLSRLDFVRRLPQCGPVLWIPNVTLEVAVQEVIAAMAAME